MIEIYSSTWLLPLKTPVLPVGEILSCHKMPSLENVDFVLLFFSYIATRLTGPKITVVKFSFGNLNSECSGAALF